MKLHIGYYYLGSLTIVLAAILTFLMGAWLFPETTVSDLPWINKLLIAVSLGVIFGPITGNLYRIDFEKIDEKKRRGEL